MVCASSGSSIITGWKRLSSAASFSICFLYSSVVVAPMTCISPLASTGFKIFAASSEPSAPPAPMTVCSSSINNKIFPASRVSFSALLILSSNSPLYLVPATMPDRSSVITLRPISPSGTSSPTIFNARPSAMAVLPTPGSPMRHGLFFVLLESISTTCSTSSSRPITGSILPSFARTFKSLAN